MPSVAVPTDPRSADALFERLGRRTHRAFVVDVVRRVRAGEEWSELILGAARTAFPRSAAIGDEAMRERARRLLSAEPICGVVRELLERRR